MAEQVIIDIAVSNEEAVARIKDATDTLKLLKQKEKELNEEYDKSNITMKEYAEQMAKVKTTMEQETNVIKANKDAIKQNVREQQSAKDSLVSMRAELKKLTTQYDNLSAAERNGAKGKELQQHISAITANITAAEEATGRFQRNVGNYTGSITKAFGQMGGAAGRMKGGIDTATQSLKMMSKTPVIAILGLLVNVIAKIISSLKKNEEAWGRIKVAMSGFTSVATLVQRVVDNVANVIAGLTEKLANLMAKLAGAQSALGKQIKTDQQLAKDEQTLLKSRRIVSEATARNEATIAELRRKANEKSKYSLEERKKMLADAEKFETANFRMRKDLAAQEYKIIKTRNAQASSGTKDLDAESEALKKLYDEQTAYENHLSGITKKQESLGGATGKTTDKQKEQEEAMKEAKKAAEEYRKELERLASQQQQNSIDWFKLEGDMKSYYEMAFFYANKTLDEMEKGAEESDIDFQARIIKARQEVQKAKEELDKFRSEQEQASQDAMQAQSDSIWEEFHNMANAYDADYQAFKAAQEEKVKTMNKFVSSVGSTLGTLSGIFGEFADENHNAAVAQAAISLAQTYIAQAQAIANVVKNAADYPFPANIAAIASSVATVVASTMSQIRQIKKSQQDISSSRYAEGGLIQGPGSGTSDSITAKVSNGEFVVNAAATRANLPELLRINGGWGNTKSPEYATGGLVGLSNIMSSTSADSMRMAMMDAVSSVQPVVSVREISNFQNKILAKERVALS